MPIRGKVGAIYLLGTAPTSFDVEPEQLEQVGGLFLWKLDVEQKFSRSFAGDVPELHCATIGWQVTAEAFWGDKWLFDNAGEIVFVRLFIEPGDRLGCLQGYVVIPPDLAGEEGKINERTIYLEGRGRPKTGGINMRNKVVSFAGKEIRVEEKKIGDLEKLIIDLFPTSKGKIANIDLGKELGALDFDILYKKLPVIFPELTKDDIKNAYMSEIEALLGAFVDVNFTGIKKLAKTLMSLAQTSLQPQK